MKKILIASCLAFAAMALYACQAQPQAEQKAEQKSPIPSKPQNDPKVVEEIRAVLQQHDKALGEKNLDALMDTFVNSPDTVVLGTGTEEKWVGPETIKNAYTEIFKDYDVGSVNISCDWKTGHHLGDVAWMAATCHAKDALKGNPREYHLNVSATMVKDDGKWRFSILHMSNLTGSQ